MAPRCRYGAVLTQLGAGVDTSRGAFQPVLSCCNRITKDCTPQGIGIRPNVFSHGFYKPWQSLIITKMPCSLLLSMTSTLAVIFNVVIRRFSFPLTCKDPHCCAWHLADTGLWRYWHTECSVVKQCCPLPAVTKSFFCESLVINKECENHKAISKQLSSCDFSPATQEKMPGSGGRDG